MIKNRFGFTLVETLITLGIIGVIAGLTLPNAIAGRMAAQARTQFNSAYAILGQAIADMTSDGITLFGGRFIQHDMTLYDQFKSYMRVSVDCGRNPTPSKVCPAGVGNSYLKNGYETYSGSWCNEDKTICRANINWFIDDGAFVLPNGMLVGFENNSGDNQYTMISIDINGKNKSPNRWGWDIFTFQVVGEDVLPVGAKGTMFKETITDDYRFDEDPDRWCDATDSSGKMNGITCSYKALEDEDYFKKIYGGR